MCLAKAYLKDGGEGELVIEDVALLEVEGRMVRLSTIFGEQKELEARLKRTIDQDGDRLMVLKLDPRAKIHTLSKAEEPPDPG